MLPAPKETRDASENRDSIPSQVRREVWRRDGNYSGRLRSNRQEWEAVEGEAEVFEYRQAVFA